MSKSMIVAATPKPLSKMTDDDVRAWAKQVHEQLVEQDSPTVEVVKFCPSTSWSRSNVCSMTLPDDVRTPPTEHSDTGISGVLVGSTVGPEGAVPLSTAAGILGVSPRRARQFADAGRLVIVDHGPPLLVSHASVREVANTRTDTGQTVAVRGSKPLPASDLAAIIDLIRHEHAATLDALNARSTDLTAARDALAAQVKDLRAENRRERAETKRQRAETARERERADTLAAENELLRSTPKPRSRSKL